ncbi:hypothetical protein BRADI_4g14497v3 [Brachypodium distachyon]|uniref:Uncharacterized protein n=1 Tax=Brachypodium distachyon TaxID=15368 RepID=A0A2K2CMT1_BRADI|nr:hypothetical protein BRADI_4g14497v3 [Brachypodium distachyon]
MYEKKTGLLIPLIDHFTLPLFAWCVDFQSWIRAMLMEVLPIYFKCQCVTFCTFCLQIYTLCTFQLHQLINHLLFIKMQLLADALLLFIKVMFFVHSTGRAT